MGHLQKMPHICTGPYPRKRLDGFIVFEDLLSIIL